jgi:glycosyltransferase involved in cell wall biosynthesis
LRVAIITTFADKIIKSRPELVKSIIEKGHSLTVLGCEPAEQCNKELNPYNIDYVKISFERSNVNPYKEIKFILTLAKVLNFLKIETLLVYGVRLAPSVAIASKLVRVKRCCAVINGAGTLFNIKGMKGITIRTLAYPLLFSGLRSCDKILFQNMDNYNLFTKLKLLNKEKALIVNGSGVNLEKYSMKPIGNDYIFLFVGRLIRDKGIFEYISAAKEVKVKYPQSKFIVIGPYDDNLTALSESELKSLISEGLIEYIPWTDRINDYLVSCYSFVLPSYHEGTPRTVLEAMATGRAIITTDAPGCRETVTDGINGFLVPVGDIEQLVEKIIWMIEHKAEVESMGQKSHDICKEKYDVYNINKNILKSMCL